MASKQATLAKENKLLLKEIATLKLENGVLKRKLRPSHITQCSPSKGNHRGGPEIIPPTDRRIRPSSKHNKGRGASRRQADVY
ncbi:hypothetical protein PG993_014855 [Apiospora rasikravindrae]|uniref:Transposase n=1 Tax=Apiospora rasikravindrae TaxID=990691 RepID=A0ABR1RNX5_9PEZI